MLQPPTSNTGSRCWAEQGGRGQSGVWGVCMRSGRTWKVSFLESGGGQREAAAKVLQPCENKMEYWWFAFWEKIVHLFHKGLEGRCPSAMQCWALGEPSGHGARSVQWHEWERPSDGPVAAGDSEKEPKTWYWLTAREWLIFTSVLKLDIRLRLLTVDQPQQGLSTKLLTFFKYRHADTT